MINDGIIVFKDISIKEYNTYRIDAKVKYFIKVLNITGLIKLLEDLKKNNINYYLIGNGSNVILDEYFDGALIKLEGLNKITIDKETVTCEAGAMMGKLALACVNDNLTGLEWAINIPGTVGGSIIGNAGAYNSEITDNLISIKVINKDLEIKELKKDDFHFEYRNTDLKERDLIVIEAKFKLEPGNKEESLALMKDRCERRIATQPLDMPSAGSVFRNPDGDFAGRLIEEAGLKGKQIGGAQISEKHANFIVNKGTATSNDIKSLIKLIQDKIKERFGIDLILEQEIVDWNSENEKNSKKSKTQL